MERLTKRNGEMVWLKRDGLFLEPCEVLSSCDGRDIRNVLVRMAAYEDTGLTPEEITALQASNKEIKKDALPLMRAKIQDRLVVLPCKVTDTVYITETVFENGKQKRRNKPRGEQVVSAQIDHVTIGGTTGKPVFDVCSETGGWYYSVEPEDFYLTREEAEKAMKEG